MMTRFIGKKMAGTRLPALAAISMLGLALGGCASAKGIDQLYQRVRADQLTSRVFTHSAYWRIVEPWLAAPLQREQIGASADGRPLYLVQFGSGPTKVLMWSQMHGDESTATMALADLMQYLHTGDERTRMWSDKLTILMIPLLNPDGAQRFTRHNSYGIDINRDARMLVTPEAQALKAIHDRFKPDFGFNLHDQSVRTLIAGTDRLAAIALLAPAFDESRSDNPGRIRAKQVAAVVRDAVEPLVGGYVAKYDDSFNPRAFGDLIQQWGTSTVLIESGGWRGDPDKQHLRKANFAAFVAALDAIATRSYERARIARYEKLPFNGSQVYELLIRGGTVVLPGHVPYRADIAVNVQEQFGHVASAEIAEVGDLNAAQARDTVDLTGLFLHADGHTVQQEDVADRRAYLPRRAPPHFLVRRTASPDSEVVYSINGITVTRF